MWLRPTGLGPTKFPWGGCMLSSERVVTYPSFRPVSRASDLPGVIDFRNKDAEINGFWIAVATGPP